MTLTARDYFALPASQIDASVEQDFYGSLKMRNGTFKLTAATRFAEIEAAFREIFRERAPCIRHALDVGVSTGTTTVELADFLLRHGSPAKTVATDLYVNAKLVEPLAGVFVLTDSSGWPLQYEVLGKAVRSWNRRLDYLTLKFIPRALLRNALAGRVRASIEAGKFEPVQMIGRTVHDRDDITVVEDDILRRSGQLASAFDFVRAANILNSNYFSAADLDRAIGNIASYLKGPGSMLLVTRTNRARANAGTLFEYRAGGTFAVLGRVGGGSEIEDMVLRHAG
ncbi:MAG: ATP-binding protein [Rhizobiales bacterium]|nr:ATP-binding protein [Hyphomicrobiales bacterium]